MKGLDAEKGKRERESERRRRKSLYNARPLSVHFRLLKIRFGQKTIFLNGLTLDCHIIFDS